ncbi:MAG: ATP-binding protein [bacterium]
MNYKIEPKASSILGSLRSIGYDLKTALADIIDNSISAGAKKIEIVNNDISGLNPKLEWLAIVDDGEGMTLPKMVEAFILGGDGIESLREDSDLGRFGLGLKTASFSQCRKLTVISKTKKTKIKSLVFDLNFIISNKNKWEAYTLNDPDLALVKIKSRLFNQGIFEQDSWTLVLWENIDKKIIQGNKIFYEELEKVREHISLIFHKYEKGLEIRLNNTKIIFWDPYATAISSAKKNYRFNSEGESFHLKTHLLKHNSEFNNQNEYNDQSRIGSFNKNQGFFIYRKNRLIYHGGWLGLYPNEHNYILARVEINLSNSFTSDSEWNVNISKSLIDIPSFALNDIIQECDGVRSSANDVFRFHGGIKKNVIRTKKKVNEINSIWNFESKGDKDGLKDYYEINKEHPIIKSFSNGLSNKEVKKQFNQLLKYIENYLPIDNIFVRKANQNIVQPRQENSIIYEKFKSIFNIMKEETGLENAFQTLINVEPFNRITFDKKMLDDLGINYEKNND